MYANLTILSDIVRVTCNTERRFQPGSVGGVERGVDSLAAATSPCNADPPASRRPALPTSLARPHNSLITYSFLCFHASWCAFFPLNSLSSVGSSFIQPCEIYKVFSLFKLCSYFVNSLCLSLVMENTFLRLPAASKHPELVFCLSGRAWRRGQAG